MNRKALLVLIVLAMLTAACNSPGVSSPTPISQPSFTAGMPQTSTAASPGNPPTAALPVAEEPATATATTAPTETAAPTITPAEPTATFTALAPSETPTPAATLAPLKLRGNVTIQQAVCHYGPGAPYLYKYGVYQGSNLELLRRVEGGSYVEIQAIGGSNPCWVRVDYFDIKGDWMDLPPVRFDQVRLPITPYYASPGGVSARRDGSEVTVFWNPLYLDPGNSSEQTPYIVEAWVCQGGKNVFVPAGTDQTAVRIHDEPGCPEPSYGYFIAAEKHGYTPRVKVPWPAQ